MKKNKKLNKSKKQNRAWNSQLMRMRKDLKVMPLADLKQQAIEKAVIATKGDKQLAAVLLGIGKTTIYRALGD